ncbi:hypothetical protein ACWDF5_47860, partial [Streptomyces sp. NPDC001076]
IVGMMHAAGDWWLGERPCSRAELVKSLAALLQRGSLAWDLSKTKENP